LPLRLWRIGLGLALRVARLARLLIGREGLIELLLRRLAGSIGPNHRLLLRRIARLLSWLVAKRHSVLIDHRLHLVGVGWLIPVHFLLGGKLPVGHRHLRLELFHRAVCDRDAHEVMEGACRRSAAL
jgi:hypothetical protein